MQACFGNLCLFAASCSSARATTCLMDLTLRHDFSFLFNIQFFWCMSAWREKKLLTQLIIYFKLLNKRRVSCCLCSARSSGCSRTSSASLVVCMSACLNALPLCRFSCPSQVCQNKTKYRRAVLLPDSLYKELIVSRRVCVSGSTWVLSCALSNLK